MKKVLLILMLCFLSFVFFELSGQSHTSSLKNKKLNKLSTNKTGDIYDGDPVLANILGTKKRRTFEKKAKLIKGIDQSLAEKGMQMNHEFGEKGIPYKTQIKNFAGKKYIEIVELPGTGTVKPAKTEK